MQKNISNNMMNRNRIETVFDACKYKGCTNRRLNAKGGVHLFRFPSRGDARLLAWIKNTGNKLILNWSLSTLRKAGICGEHFNDDSFLNSDRTKLKSNAIPEPFKEPATVVINTTNIWDHTYSKELANNEIDLMKVVGSLEKSSKSMKYKCSDKLKNDSCKVRKLAIARPSWSSNPTFIRTYSRKLSFKDVDDSMEWTAIEPISAKDNIGGRKVNEGIKRSVTYVETATVDELIQETENREIKELRVINMELRRQNKILRIENFKLQLRLAQNKRER